MNSVNNSQNLEAMPLYLAPTITTYTADELLDMVGPVQAGSHGDEDNLMGAPTGYIHKILNVA